MNKIKNWWLKINSRKAIISTMPRSGTWWTALFFLNLDAALQGKNVSSDKYNYPQLLNSLGLEVMMGHLIFPELKTFVSPKNWKSWKILTFFDEEHYNFGARFVKDLKGFSPEKNPKLKIIYIYRNPLDQAVSAYYHFKNHKNEKIQNLVRQISIDEYIKRYALEGYLKQYLSYKLAKGSYHNLQMIKYENMKKNPRLEFTKMCNFLEINLKTQKMQEAFETALQKVSYNQVQAFEKRLGRSIGDDQQKKGTHMRGGKIGKYRNIVSLKTILYVKWRLKHYKLKLSEL
jgi:hypothetical protein